MASCVLEEVSFLRLLLYVKLNSASPVIGMLPECVHLFCVLPFISLSINGLLFPCLIVTSCIIMLSSLPIYIPCLCSYPSIPWVIVYARCSLAVFCFGVDVDCDFFGLPLINVTFILHTRVRPSLITSRLITPPVGVFKASWFCSFAQLM